MGQIDEYSGFVSHSHPVHFIKTKDERYWLPTDSDAAYIVIRFDDSTEGFMDTSRGELSNASFPAASSAGVMVNGGGGTSARGREQEGRTRLRRLTAFRFQNRYSTTFEVWYRRRSTDDWSILIAPQPSGPMKGIKEVLFTKGSIPAQSIKIVIRGRPNTSYSTSIYWVEVCGR